MSAAKRVSSAILCTLMLLFATRAARAQKPVVPSRVIEEVNDSRTVQTKGNIHPLARAEFDHGAVAESQPMTRMLLLLQRSAEQEAALQQLLEAQQTKGSSSYHAWLTPEQFGAQFGPSDADLQKVTDWLTRQGFAIPKVSKGRTTIEFNGTVAQVRDAFQTDIHKFSVNGKEHFANVSDPAIPEALSPVVKGVVSLHNFPKYSHAHKVGVFQRDLATGQVKRLFTYTDKNGTFYGVGPADFKKIYNIPPGADGSGQSIAIVGQSNINAQDVIDFRHVFGLDQSYPANNVTVILNGPDPGLVDGDEGESDLDVEWAGAVAPAATIKFVTSQSTQSNPTQVTAGIDLSALYIVDNNVAPVLSESYGACESLLTTAGNNFYNTLWQQAAAQGITVAISSGDNGSAGCDPTSTNPNAATQGIAISGLASTPYNVAVGGTDFDQSGSESTYWHAGTVSDPNDPTTQLSAKSYIPEVPWDNSTCAANFPTACTAVNSKGDDITAGSGGPSSIYARPPWQTSLIPSATFRQTPDVSFFASNGFNNSFYIVCQSDQDPNNAPCDLSTSASSGTHNFLGVGGTSGSTPAFAGVMALVNQYEQAHGRSSRQGNANVTLYGLAAQDSNYTTGKCGASLGSTPVSTCVFNDVTKGSNSVACVAGKPNCSNSTASGFGILVTGSNVPAFKAVAGYDDAVGLGSINIANLLTTWSTVNRSATTTALLSPSGSSVISGQNFSVKVTVTPSAAAGDVSLTALANDQTTILGSVGPFTLTSGSVTASSNLLPLNTAFVEAYYAGDTIHASSTSAPLALAVNGANQTSKTVLSWVSFDASNNPILNTGSQTATYGSPYILQIAVTNSGGTGCTSGSTSTKQTTPCPTGTISLTDNGSPLNDYPNGAASGATNKATLNNQGIAEDQPVQLSPGSHSIVAVYAGDPNYAASTSNTLSVTVNKAAPTATLASNLSTITSGTSVTLTMLVSTQSNGAGPTGLVTFTNGSTSLGTAACTPANATATAGASCTATLTTAISSLYPAPYISPRTPLLPFVLLAMALAIFLGLIRWMPQHRRHAYAYAGLIVFALLATAIAGCGGGGGSSGGGGKTVTLNASYPGDTNYSSSTGSTSIHVN